LNKDNLISTPVTKLFVKIIELKKDSSILIEYIS